MMKFYKKKEITQEKTPILFRLERRHTVLEGGPHEISENEPKGRASRANSVGSYTSCETPNDKKRPAAISKLCTSEDNRSNFSAASTVVITESELSSSWLYKARRAKIDSEEEGNISTSSNIPNEDNDMQPVPLKDPKLKPVPVPIKPRKEKEHVSSCCCYLLVAITICIASLGIMAAIGGIVYLEVFAHYKDIIDSQHTTQTPPLDTDIGRKGKIEGSLENKVTNSGVVTDDFLPEVKHKDKNLKSKENNEVSPKDTTINLFVDESSKESNPMVDPNSKGGFDPSELVNVYTKLDQISKHQELEEDSDKLGDKKEIENTEAQDSGLKDTTHIEGNESLSNVQVFLDNANDNFVVENQGNHVEITGISKDNPNLEDLDPVQKTKFQDVDQETLNNHVEEDNLDISKTDTSPDEDPESENVLGFEPKLRKLFDIDESFVLNRPIVEARPPIEFINRLRGNQNPNLNELTIKDMDQTFTLSEILKHLRTLDDSDRLPSSRQKDGVTESLRFSTQDIGLERNEYLDKLRRKIYS